MFLYPDDDGDDNQIGKIFRLRQDVVERGVVVWRICEFADCREDCRLLVFQPSFCRAGLGKFAVDQFVQGLGLVFEDIAMNLKQPMIGADVEGEDIRGEDTISTVSGHDHAEMIVLTPCSGS